MSQSKMSQMNEIDEENYSTETKNRKMTLSQSAYQIRQNGGSVSLSKVYDDNENVTKEIAKIESKQTRAEENRKF